MHATILAAAAAVTLVSSPWTGDGDAGSFWCQQDVARMERRVESLRPRLDPDLYDELRDWLRAADSQCFANVHDSQQSLRMIRERLEAALGGR